MFLFLYMMIYDVILLNKVICAFLIIFRLYSTMSGRRLSLELRTEIATLYGTNEYSMEALSLKYNISTSTVHNIVKKKAKFNTVIDRPRSGRPKISSGADDRRLLLLSLRDRRLTAKQLQEQWHVNSCVSTVKARLLSAGLRGCVADKKPLLNAKQRLVRLRWCLARRTWTVEQWRQVCFVDESAFSLIPNTVRTFVRRRPSEIYNGNCVAVSARHRSPKLMVFGGISGSGVGPLYRCVGNVNAHSYRDILVSYEDYLHGKMLAQDNAPCHKARLVMGWLHEHHIEVLPWPPYSPDLNPIENLWAVMKSRVKGKEFPTKDSLWVDLQAIWNTFSQDFIRKYVDSMPRRVAAVILAKGGSTRY